MVTSPGQAAPASLEVHSGELSASRLLGCGVLTGEEKGSVTHAAARTRHTPAFRGRLVAPPPVGRAGVSVHNDLLQRLRSHLPSAATLPRAAVRCGFETFKSNTSPHESKNEATDLLHVS